jgi:hypothetical protein
MLSICFLKIKKKEKKKNPIPNIINGVKVD